MDAIKLSPSDLTFLWDECPRCFYLKVTGRLSRPSTAFPSIFSSIDSVALEDQPATQQVTDAAIVLNHQDAFGHTGFQFVWCGKINRARL